MQTKTSRMDGRQKFLMFKEVAEIAIKENGTVFGGYVRDSIRHDHAATKFYETHNRKDFTNMEVSPDTIDRLLIPSDIDIHFKTYKEYRLFRSALKGSFYCSTITKIENIYTNGSPNVSHLKMRVGLELSIGHVVSNMKSIRKSPLACEILLPELTRCMASMSTPTDHIDVDILISKDSVPPFDNTLDFACNGLVMNIDGVSMCSEIKKGMSPFGIHRTFQGILSDIYEKRAKLITLKEHRWNKMAEKGWDLLGGNIEKIRSIDESETTCTLCLDAISKSDIYKFSCCNAKYHRVCIAKIMTKGVAAVVDTDRCPHCRQTIILDSSEVEIFGEVIDNIF